MTAAGAVASSAAAAVIPSSAAAAAAAAAAPAAEAASMAAVASSPTAGYFIPSANRPSTSDDDEDEFLKFLKSVGINPNFEPDDSLEESKAVGKTASEQYDGMATDRAQLVDRNRARLGPAVMPMQDDTAVTTQVLVQNKEKSSSKKSLLSLKSYPEAGSAIWSHHQRTVPKTTHQLIEEGAKKSEENKRKEEEEKRNHDAIVPR